MEYQMGRKKSQASMEYIMIVGASLLIVLSLSYFFFVQKHSTDSAVTDSNINQLGKELSANIEDIYFSTGANLRRMDFDLPAGTEIRVEHGIQKGLNFLVISTSDEKSWTFPIKGEVVAFIDEAASGVLTLKKVRHEDGTEIVLLCAIEEANCNLAGNEAACNNPPCCSNGWDDDGDGKVDGQDFDCCKVDKDGDGFTPIDGGENPVNCSVPLWGRDCDDEESSTNPDAVEFCDNIDNDCNGAIDDNNACGIFEENVSETAGGITFRLERNDPNTDNLEPGQCQPGYVALISLSSYGNAHAEVSGGVNLYPYDLCYFPNVENCALDCTVTDENACPVGYTRILGLADKNITGGTHAETFEKSNYNDNVCCDSCGTLECEIRENAVSCEANETCIISLVQGTDSHLGPCIGMQQYPDKLCCRNTFT